ncbi:helix-turn-helix transcriptional regulator [Larsenimonas rhizosphaerae]|uniref:AlpA family transcriptional regulator n=1 Tax=Larsenimonas rhizosphaerae TaxID=2944682 RepID=A0AA41ZFN4_9GAMM|nr:AlpA family transcriptional regulator [Larsenimonas rhizosphaerae]MCX2524432.1 AlpA family transcriptional regulator [Larsenimonas rhizosphaerae]
MTASTHSNTGAYQHVERIQLGNRLLRRREVELKTGKSRSSIYKGVSDGTFPAPVPIGDNSVAWLEEEIDGWIAERLAQRNATLKMTAQEARP